MYYVCFDQAAGTTGYSVFDNNGLIEYGKFKSTQQEYLDKVSEMCDNIESLVIKYQERGKVEVYLEDIQLQADVVTFKKLAQLQGAISDRLRNNLDIEIKDFISAASWKSTAKIKGRGRTEQKKNAQKKITELYNIKATQDESDAILIGLHVSEQGFNWE